MKDAMGKVQTATRKMQRLI